jgi:hypothetical protein
MPWAKNIIIAIICGCLLGCLRLPAGPFEQPETGVYGQITGGHESADSVWVYAYRHQQGGFRGPADFAVRADGDGQYLLDLVPGRWFLVARSRQGAVTGPPRSGDGWVVYQKNPVVLQPHEALRIDLQLQPVAQTPLLRGGNVAQSETGFTGRLLGPDNKPVTGAVALAYRDQDYRRMPDHSSVAVATDGRFTLYVATPGSYCLLARQGSRGQPRQGELYGLLGIGDAACRNLANGEMLNVGEIHLTPYLR